MENISGEITNLRKIYTQTETNIERKGKTNENYEIDRMESKESTKKSIILWHGNIYLAARLPLPSLIDSMFSETLLFIAQFSFHNDASRVRARARARV